MVDGTFKRGVMMAAATFVVVCGAAWLLHGHIMPAPQSRPKGSVPEGDGDGVVDDDDDDGVEKGGEQKERSQSETPPPADFAAASALMRSSRAPKNLSQEQQLRLYALFKQASEGDCEQKQPSQLDFVARAKWDARHALLGMSTENAQNEYVAFVTELVSISDASSLRSKQAGDKSDPNSAESSGSGDGGGDVALGGITSRMKFSEGCNTEEEEARGWAIGEDVHFLASTGDEIGLLSAIDCDPTALEAVDEEGRTPLHWACDRGHLSLVEELVQRGADLCAKDNDGVSALEYAAMCDHADVVRALVRAGAPTSDLDEECIGGPILELIRGTLAV